jgi:hypothetical protein
MKLRTPRSWPSRLRGATIALLATTALAGCSDELLTVEDPDIINPDNVQSAAGAESVRLGTLGRLVGATSGGSNTGDNIFLLGGMLADEWINGDSFIARQEIDQRVITRDNSFATGSGRQLHRARLSAELALELLRTHNPGAPGWQVAEMHFVLAYVTNLLAEHYCSGLVFSTALNGDVQYGSPITTQAALERALKNAEDGLALLPATATTANDVRVRRALQVTRGRILMNLNRPADAAAAVAGVPTDFRYRNQHSERTESNYIWMRNNLNRRYSVGNGEGRNGLNFATANDPRVPVCLGNDTRCRTIGVTNSSRDDQQQPYHVQMIWTGRDSAVAIVAGTEARMIEAEAALRADRPGDALAVLNTARTTVTGLAPLTLQGTPEARVNQLFRERAFWHFGRGMRLGDLRRLVRQYGRPQDQVFPTGAWHKNDAQYGGDMNLPIPAAEANNPNAQGAQCINRDA